MRSFDRMDIAKEAGTIKRAVYLTDRLKSRFKSSMLERLFAKLGKSESKGKMMILIAEAKRVITWKFPTSTFVAKKAKIIVWY